MKEVGNFEHCVQTAVTNMAKKKTHGWWWGGGGSGNENIQC